MIELRRQWTDHLVRYREQGMRVGDINPIAALADIIFEQLHGGEINRLDLNNTLDSLGVDLWKQQTKHLRVKASAAEDQLVFPNLEDHNTTQQLYRAVFTAHPTFALNADVSATLCKEVDVATPEIPENAYGERQAITLQEEHDEAMCVIRNARRAICKLNEKILEQRQSHKSENWRQQLPQMLGVSTWVGYDLDGRSDISWSDSFKLRLAEKAQSLKIYCDAIKTTKISAVETILDELHAEQNATEEDILRFEQLGSENVSFSSVINTLTERPDKLISSFKVAEKIHSIAKSLSDEDKAKELMVVAADIKTHGFGMAEVHLRINSIQLQNAMRPIDGIGSLMTDGMVSARSLIDKLSSRIANEAPWQINFKNLDDESATARRQLMLAAQFLKHIDCDQPIRLLIAECEKPITIMSALYLAEKLGIADKLDISPLFETSYGLEHGEQIIDQLLSHQAYSDYIRRRGCLSIQTGFSDAGRFIGQIAANMAIERLQIKIANCLKDRIEDEITLLIFNTHGESLGRGCFQSTVSERQNFIMTPFVRARASEIGVPIYHQSSFQGGDGFRLFGTPELAECTMTRIFLAEITPPQKKWLSDPFYQQTDFSLDLFISLKNWHETLFLEASYSDLLDVFASNLLPISGSRPAKRVVQSGNERSDPSKIRAIPHNAILQQLGFLANVISGMGTAAYTNIEQFAEVYQKSPRLQQCLKHILKAKSLGSLNTVLAYSRLIDAGFWVDRAYHYKQYKNQPAFRKLGQHLQDDTRTTGIRHAVWRLRDDLIDLYRLVERVGDESIRISGQKRVTLDLLHAIRIALIIDSLTLICNTPSFGENNHHSNDNIISIGLRLDFPLVISIIKSAFTADNADLEIDNLAEPENYSGQNTGNFSIIDKQVLTPLSENHRIIRKITQMISGHYGAHG